MHSPARRRTVGVALFGLVVVLLYVVAVGDHAARRPATTTTTTLSCEMLLDGVTDVAALQRTFEQVFRDAEADGDIDSNEAAAIGFWARSLAEARAQGCR
jgi:hypothetical protein